MLVYWILHLEVSELVCSDLEHRGNMLLQNVETIYSYYEGQNTRASLSGGKKNRHQNMETLFYRNFHLYLTNF